MDISEQNEDFRDYGVIILRIYNAEECNQYLERTHDWNRRNIYNVLRFTFKNEKDQAIVYSEVPDTWLYMYAHSEQVIRNMFDEIAKNFPKTNKLTENLLIFLPRFPGDRFQNASAFSYYAIIFWGRGTQVPRSLTEYIVPHEFGHIVQNALCPEYLYEGDKYVGKNPKLAEYFTLRGYLREMVKSNRRIEGTDEYEEYEYEDWKRPNDSTPWHECWQEWFAEDFRYLFGGPKGNQDFWGLEGIIDPPDERIREFMLNL